MMVGGRILISFMCFMMIVPYVIELSQIDWTCIIYVRVYRVSCLRYSYSFVYKVNNKCLHQFRVVPMPFLFAESVFDPLTSLSLYSTSRKWIDYMYRHFDEERVWLSPDEIHTDNCFRFKLKANKGIEYNSKLIANKWKTFNWINIDVQSERFNTIGSFHKWYSLCSSVLLEIFGYSNVVDSYHEYRTIEISQVASHNANLLFIAKPFSFKTLMLFNFQNNEAQCEKFSALKICWNSVWKQQLEYVVLIPFQRIHFG